MWLKPFSIGQDGWNSGADIHYLMGYIASRYMLYYFANECSLVQVLFCIYMSDSYLKCQTYEKINEIGNNREH